MKSDVVVIGSLNYDILIQQDRLPEVGETFTGNELMLMPGGKVLIKRYSAQNWD